ncbi:MAG TPA: type II toxin-antitoxin system VapC family toxin [Actinomycetota bacterium]
MSLLYADTSALLRAYFADEREHSELRSMLLEGEEPVVSTEIARVELASAARAAARAGRFRRWKTLLARIDADCQEDGPIALLGLRPEIVLPTAYRLVVEHRLRTLDALHPAVALEECPALAGDEDVVFVTRDGDQASAAKKLGLPVR